MRFANNGQRRGGFSIVFVLAAAIAVAGVASANMEFYGSAIEITADNAAGGASLGFPSESMTWDASTSSLRWTSGGELQLVDPDSGEVVATLESAELQIRDGSRYALSFQIIAGDDNATIVLRTGKLSFPSLAGDAAEGRATASFTISDMNGDGAFVIGEGGGGVGAFRAYYNGPAPDGTRFAHLVGLVSASGGGSATGSQSEPAVGFAPIGTDVDDMSVEVAFVVTAHDRVTASVVFDLNPDPEGWADDADGDQLPDWLDGCPNDSDKIDPGACGCGVPDEDLDQNGTPDCLDDEDDPPDEDPADGEDVGDPNNVPDDSGIDVWADADEQPSPDANDPQADDGDTPNAEQANGDSGTLTITNEDLESVRDELDALTGGIMAPCGAGAVGLLPLTLLGLGGYKAGTRRRPARRRNQDR